MRLRFELFGLASGRSWASPADAFTATTITSQYRMALLNRPSGRSLNGILLTLAAGETLIPAAVPIALVPLDPDAGSDLGVVRVGDRCFENIDAASTGSRSGTARAFLPELWPLSERR